jgi:hypothetical protein
MPRAVVMLRGANETAVNTTLLGYLRKRNNVITNETGVVVEWFLKSLGWPDFIVCLWGSNVEMFIKAISIIRDKCKADTTSIVGVMPEDTSVMVNDLNRKPSIIRSRGSSRASYADYEYIEYVSWQKAFLKQMEDSIGKKVKAKKII